MEKRNKWKKLKYETKKNAYKIFNKLKQYDLLAVIFIPVKLI